MAAIEEHPEGGLVVWFSEQEIDGLGEEAGKTVQFWVSEAIARIERDTCDMLTREWFVRIGLTDWLRDQQPVRIDMLSKTGDSIRLWVRRRRNEPS